MPGIHIPALQGIAGLKPIISTGYQNVAANQTTSIIVATIPSDKIGILTDLAFVPMFYDLTLVWLAVYVPTVAMQYFIDYRPTLVAYTAMRVNCLIALPPGGSIRIGFTTGANATLIDYGASYILFDYFGED